MTDSLPPQLRSVEMQWIAYTSLQGSLGLFAGTGLSRAATGNRAPTFEQLLVQLALRLGLTPDLGVAPQYSRKSLPQIASQLLTDFSRTIPSGNPSQRFREEIAQLCHFMPDPVAAGQLAPGMQAMTPAWIITTNYDLIIECLIESSNTVLPNQPLSPNPNRVPVYHLHGTRQNPPTIKITEEDYVGLIGPIDYQRLKLPLLLLESTTLVLGYGLGDINVRAAVAWANSFRGERGLQLEPWQGRIVQALHSTYPNPYPYQGPNGEIIIEISDIATFLQELAAVRQGMEQALSGVRASISAFLLDPNNPIAVATNAAKRIEFLAIVRNTVSFCDPGALVRFVDSALSPIWLQATRLLQFSYYADYLNLLIDILETLTLSTCRPSVLSYLADALGRVAQYIDPKKAPGTAFQATDDWLKNHPRIRDEIKRELWSYAAANDRKSLTDILQLAPLAHG
jgi:SIR2-like domain